MKDIQMFVVVSIMGCQDGGKKILVLGGVVDFFRDLFFLFLIYSFVDKCSQLYECVIEIVIFKCFFKIKYDDLFRIVYLVLKVI